MERTQALATTADAEADARRSVRALMERAQELQVGAPPTAHEGVLDAIGVLSDQTLGVSS